MREKDAMKEPWIKEVVPVQSTGQSSFTHSSRNCRNDYHVLECYKDAAERLRNVNHWQEYAGEATAGFQVFDGAGNSVNRPVQQGDYLCINIPGPNNPDGNGGDWVQVLQIGEKSIADQQITFMTVRSATNPLVNSDKPAHFFDQPATSTFMVYRKKLTITAAVFGRNEHSNQQSGNLFTRIRNWFVFIGAQLGLANLQWKALTRGLLK